MSRNHQQSEDFRHEEQATVKRLDAEARTLSKETVAVPGHIHRVAVLSLKQYALVMDGMQKSATSIDSRETFARTLRDIVDVIHLLERAAL
jgi:hypothetical protein